VQSKDSGRFEQASFLNEIESDLARYLFEDRKHSKLTEMKVPDEG